jgi:polyphosphate kinase
MHVLQVELADTVQARLMQPTGEYVRVDRRGKPAVDSQQSLCREAMAAAGGTAAGESYTFTPRTAPPEGS